MREKQLVITSFLHLKSCVCEIRDSFTRRSPNTRNIFAETKAFYWFIDDSLHAINVIESSTNPHDEIHDFSNVSARSNHDSHQYSFFIGIKKDFSFRSIWKIRSCMRGARACSESRDDRPLPPMCVPAQDPIEQALTPRDDVEAKKREKE